jgi:hypothetical protein
MQRYRRVISTNPKPQKLDAGHLVVNNRSKRKAGSHFLKIIVILRKNRKQSYHYFHALIFQMFNWNNPSRTQM